MELDYKKNQNVYSFSCIIKSTVHLDEINCDNWEVEAHHSLNDYSLAFRNALNISNNVQIYCPDRLTSQAEQCMKGFSFKSNRRHNNCSSRFIIINILCWSFKQIIMKIKELQYLGVLDVYIFRICRTYGFLFFKRRQDTWPVRVLRWISCLSTNCLQEKQ